MGGVRKNEIETSKKTHLYELMEDHYPFYLDQCLIYILLVIQQLAWAMA